MNTITRKSFFAYLAGLCGAAKAAESSESKPETYVIPSDHPLPPLKLNFTIDLTKACKVCNWVHPELTDGELARGECAWYRDLLKEIHLPASPGSVDGEDALRVTL